MSAPELNAKCADEIDKIQRQRKAQCLRELSAEQINRIRRIISAREAVLHRIRAGCEHTKLHFVPLGTAILVLALVVGVAVVKKILRR